MIGDSGRVLIKDRRQALIRDPGRFPGEWIWDGSGRDLGGFGEWIWGESGMDLGWFWNPVRIRFLPDTERNPRTKPAARRISATVGRTPQRTLSGPLFLPLLEP